MNKYIILCSERIVIVQKMRSTESKKSEFHNLSVCVSVQSARGGFTRFSIVALVSYERIFYKDIDTLIGKRLNSKMPTFQESPKTVFTQMELSSAKPYIAVTAILVVNTMKIDGVKTFAVHNLT